MLFQGRMKFVRPLYRDLYAWEEKRQQAIDTFKAHRLLLSVDKVVVVVVVVVFNLVLLRKQYMQMAADMVAKDLHLDD